jgi:hypothetical protein
MGAWRKGQVFRLAEEQQTQYPPHFLCFYVLLYGGVNSPPFRRGLEGSFSDLLS